MPETVNVAALAQAVTVENARRKRNFGARMRERMMEYVFFMLSFI
jgi:hypothetical protein